MRGVVGLVVNPVAGTDVRRLTGTTPTSTIGHKVIAARRVLCAAAAGGVAEVQYMPDRHRIVERALHGAEVDICVRPVPIAVSGDETDTTRAAQALAAAGTEVVVVLGGDGTNRAVALGAPEAIIVPVSTGTNNVFPQAVDPSLAGMAAAVLARGAVPREDIVCRTKVIRVAVDGHGLELALVDAVLTDDRITGTGALLDPGALQVGVFSRTDAAASGPAAVAGCVEACSADDDFGVVVTFGPGTTVRAPFVSGRWTDVGVADARRLALGEIVDATSAAGGAMLALDGERRHRLSAGTRVAVQVVRSLLRVADVKRTVRAAAREGILTRVEAVWSRL